MPNQQARNEAKGVLVAFLVLALVMGIAGYKARSDENDRHLQFCAEHPRDRTCK